MELKALLQEIFDIACITEDNSTRQALNDLYNRATSLTVTPCAARDENNTQCAERAVKLACFKSHTHMFTWTIYLGLCAEHLESITDLNEQFNINVIRFAIGDKQRCEVTPFYAASDGNR